MENMFSLLIRIINCRLFVLIVTVSYYRNIAKG